MPSRICCQQDHSTKSISVYEAAIALSEARSLGICKKCGKDLEYRIDHAYAGDPTEREYKPRPASFVCSRDAGFRFAKDRRAGLFLLYNYIRKVI